MSLFTWSLVSALNDARTFGDDRELKSDELLEKTLLILTEYWQKNGSNQPCPVAENTNPFTNGASKSPDSPFDGNSYPKQCSRRLSLGGRSIAIGRR